MNAQGLPGYGQRVAVALSGGKDSMTALRLLVDLRDQRRPDIDVVAISVDEGIKGYRPESLQIAARAANAWNVEHVVKQTRDVAGFTIDQAHEQSPGPQCGVCGVFRRRLLNDAARHVEADALVTGHNLDDMAQSVLMNVSTANLESLARLAPHERVQAGLVPRLLPLRTIPEVEVYLYAAHRGLEWHDGTCPYAERAQRGVFRDVLYTLEEARPGTRHALVSASDELKPLLSGRPGRTQPAACATCGSPTSGTRCKPCQFRTQGDQARPTHEPSGHASA